MAETITFAYTESGEDITVTLNENARGPAGADGASAWGNITGTLSAQTDLNSALALKAPLISPSFTTPSLGVATAGSINNITISTNQASAGLYIGGTIDTRSLSGTNLGGLISTTGETGAAGGYIDTHGESGNAGGNINTSIGGGAILTQGSGTASGGAIFTYATGATAGGNIDTTAGGSFTTGTGNLTGPNTSGTLALLGANTFTGQQQLAASQAATDANSAMSRGLADARYTRTLEVIQVTAETSAANTTTYADSTQCALALGVGTYIIETWQEVEGLGSTGSAKTKLRWSGTAVASGLRFQAGGAAGAYLANATPVLAQSGSRNYDTEIAFNYSSNRGGVVALRFKFVVTVAGTVYIQYAPAANPGTGQTAQINAGSFIVARQIA